MKTDLSLSVNDQYALENVLNLTGQQTVAN